MVDTVIVSTNPEDQKEDPKHIEAMVAKVDAAAEAAGGDAPTDPIVEAKVKPDWLPEKFWDAEKGEIRTEDLAKSYGALEGKLGGNKETPPAEPNAAEKSNDQTPPDATQAKEELEKKGLNLTEFSEEFSRTGSLSEDSYKKLEDAGFDRQIVDQYIAGQQAIAEKYAVEVKTVAGGEEGFTRMVEWAKSNVDAKDIEAYNKAVNSGDVSIAKLAVAGMYQRYQEANPNEPQLVTGVNSKPGADVYESIQQYMEDSRDPKYKSDPAFRAKVIAKLGRSDIL